jgi:serine/threonine protein kinase
MNWEQTQPQSEDQRSRARELSLQRTRPPRELPDYELQEFLGAGAYGEVWVGLDRNTGRRVAIKFYSHSSHVGWALIYREVEKLVLLSTDRYAVQLLDVGWESDPPYYVMDYIAHGSLADWLQRRGRPTVSESLELFREIVVGLLHAHGRGVLHCDLKPMNVLLDEDLHPRLADFGQARLSHERTPAVGTLFYMAPEQADSRSAPDARWDVYALGAILYELLTGAPPHRDQPALLKQLEQATTQSQCMRVYRDYLLSVGVPTGHLQVRGMDRTLGQIIDRCLAVRPDDRYANPQELLDALDARSARRERRPFVALGFVGPALLLLVMALFAWRGYDSAVSNTETLSQEHVVERNRFAAELAAQQVSGEIATYFDIADKESQADDLAQQLHPLLENTALRRLSEPRMSDAEFEELQRSFRDDERRLALHQYVESRLRHYLDTVIPNRPLTKFASIFVLDARGTMLAAAYDDEVVGDNVGQNFAHRAYFHGGPNELPASPRPLDTAQPLNNTHLSPVFHSSFTNRLKIAISTPIVLELNDQSTTVGVLVMTVNHGDFGYFRSATASSSERFAVLVDGRPGPERGSILVHPFINQMAAESGRPPIDLRELRVPTDVLDEELNADSARRYQDPVARHPQGASYRRDWLAAAAQVELWVSEDEAWKPSGLIVLVQEASDDVIAPVRQLGSRLLREALAAFAVVIGLSILQWYFVSRFLL